MLRGDGRATHLVSMWLDVVPMRDVISPPFTGKVVKSIVEILGLLREARSVAGGYKPFSLTPLFLQGRPLYKRAGAPGLLVLRAGNVYKARVSAMVRDEAIGDLWASTEGVVRTPYGDFGVQARRMEVYSLSSLSLRVSEDFKLTIHTPMLLSNKVMTPPNFPAKDKIPSMHRLIPTPSYIFSYLARLWNANTVPELRLPKPGGGEWSAYKIGRLSDIVVTEINYSVKPITILYDAKPGKPREIRGCVGWIHYKILHPKPRKVLDKLLALAHYMGIGRSRGIGMGQVTVEPLD